MKWNPERNRDVEGKENNRQEPRPSGFTKWRRLVLRLSFFLVLGILCLYMWDRSAERTDILRLSPSFTVASYGSQFYFIAHEADSAAEERPRLTSIHAPYWGYENRPFFFLKNESDYLQIGASWLLPASVFGLLVFWPLAKIWWESLLEHHGISSKSKSNPL